MRIRVTVLNFLQKKVQDGNAYTRYRPELSSEEKTLMDQSAYAAEHAFVGGVFLFHPNLENVMQEYEVLEPFKAFLNVPCEICHEPITEWGDYNVKLAIQGIGCGHTHCWNSQSGQMKELLKAIQKFKKDTK